MNALIYGRITRCISGGIFPGSYNTLGIHAVTDQQKKFSDLQACFFVEVNTIALIVTSVLTQQ